MICRKNYSMMRRRNSNKKLQRLKVSDPQPWDISMANCKNFLGWESWETNKDKQARRRREAEKERRQKKTLPTVADYDCYGVYREADYGFVSTDSSYASVTAGDIYGW